MVIKRGHVEEKEKVLELNVPAAAVKLCVNYVMDRVVPELNVKLRNAVSESQESWAKDRKERIRFRTI